ncbi:transaldolase family protein [Aureimonas jatrophae]|uniref:Transaldolase n=1 Tax=Aureimonas jatrophae TaxID=1166073 RepID=A0A1H0FL79_9HYPH|nr:transaldolase family protein [Aureimonas jatrophae]MBB3949965.1 transaldolase [Aureimonas jatrophae]SDN95364.1 transaldolase [Aureimonas jatrophae]
MAHRALPSSRTGLRLFLDTADREAYARWLPTGLFHGVTTNPTILERSGLRSDLSVLAGLVETVLRYPVQEVQAQAWGTETRALVETGRALAAIDPRVVVKVPVTENGMRAVCEMHAFGIRTTVTAVYASHQALTAAAAGADYVAPYFGRINDAGRDGVAVMREMRAILATAGDGTRLLVASLRSADDAARLAAAGCDTFTFGTAVAEGLFADPDTTAAARAFEEAAAR